MRKIFLFIFILMPMMCHAKLKVVTSFSIIENIVQEIAQDKVDIINIVKANQDAHIFEPTPQTSLQIIGADLIFINGLNFETWLENLIKASKFSKPIISLSKNIKFLCAEKKLKIQCTPDPHVWMDVKNVKVWVKEIVETLSKYDDVNRLYYQSNGQAYLARLDELEQYILKRKKAIKAKQPKIITAHNAFSYYENAYGLKFLSPQGASTQDEPSAFEVVEIIKIIRKEKITAIFDENITNNKIIKQISNETNIKVGGILYSDALSLPHQPASSYIKLMHHNTQIMFDSLK